MQVVLDFIRDNWLLFTGGVGGLIVFIAVPALRSVAWKGIQLAIGSIGKAIMSMLTKEFFENAVIWALRKLAKMTKGTWDDELVEKLNEELNKQKE